MTFKLGKKPARKGAVKFRLASYIDYDKLPVPPDQFGHEDLITDWGMMGNDQYGDCVWAGAAHETMLWNSEAGMTLPFSNEAVLSDYTAVTGFDPSNPNTDQGTDMAVAAEYRRTTGIVDTNGNRHKILAYLAISAGDMRELLVGMYLFTGAGIGIEFPDYAMDSFNNGQPWDYSPSVNFNIEGGHYIPCIADRGNLLVVTWGKVQQMTPNFYSRFCDEAIVYVTAENLKDGKTLEGFALDDLMSDLAQLKQNPS